MLAGPGEMVAASRPFCSPGAQRRVPAPACGGAGAGAAAARGGAGEALVKKRCRVLWRDMATAGSAARRQRAPNPPPNAPPLGRGHPAGPPPGTRCPPPRGHVSGTWVVRVLAVPAGQPEPRPRRFCPSPPCRASVFARPPSPRCRHRAWRASGPPVWQAACSSSQQGLSVLSTARVTLPRVRSAAAGVVMVNVEMG